MTKDTRPSTPQRQAEKLLQKLQLGRPSHTDPQGSYTGNPIWGEKPIQDADDL